MLTSMVELGLDRTWIEFERNVRGNRFALVIFPTDLSGRSSSAAAADWDSDAPSGREAPCQPEGLFATDVRGCRPVVATWANVLYRVAEYSPELSEDLQRFGRFICSLTQQQERERSLPSEPSDKMLPSSARFTQHPHFRRFYKSAAFLDTTDIDRDPQYFLTPRRYSVLDRRRPRPPVVAVDTTTAASDGDEANGGEPPIVDDTARIDTAAAEGAIEEEEEEWSTDGRRHWVDLRVLLWTWFGCNAYFTGNGFTQPAEAREGGRQDSPLREWLVANGTVGALTEQLGAVVRRVL